MYPYRPTERLIPADLLDRLGTWVTLIQIYASICAMMKARTYLGRAGTRQDVFCRAHWPVTVRVWMMSCDIMSSNNMIHTGELREPDQQIIVILVSLRGTRHRECLAWSTFCVLGPREGD